MKIRQMKKTDSGTYNLGNDMAPDMGLARAEIDDAIAYLQNDEGYDCMDGYIGWGIVMMHSETGDLISISY